MQSNVQVDPVLPLFQDIMYNSDNMEVQRIPFLDIRNVTKSGILRLAANFTGHAKEKLGTVELE